MSDTCDHCGGRVGQYSHGCPGCGAPQCCQLCCTGNHEALHAEVERLTAWVDDLQSGMYVNCVYCGHRYGPGETTPVSMSDALKAHVEQCPQHPMSALRAELAALRAELAVLRNNQLGPVPEGPLKALGAWVADHTDDDTWPNAERYLNAALAEMEALRAERDAALVAVKAMHKLLDRDWAIVDRDITLRCESHDQAWNYLHEMRDLVRAALGER